MVGYPAPAGYVRGALPFKEKTTNQRCTAKKQWPHAAGPHNAEPPSLLSQPFPKYQAAKEGVPMSNCQVHVVATVGVCVCVILYFYPATCGPKGHGSGSAAAYCSDGSCF